MDPVIFAPRIPCDKCLAPNMDKCTCPRPIPDITDAERHEVVFQKMKDAETARCTLCNQWFEVTGKNAAVQAGFVGHWSRSCKTCWTKLTGNGLFVNERDYY